MYVHYPEENVFFYFEPIKLENQGYFFILQIFSRKNISSLFVAIFTSWIIFKGLNQVLENFEMIEATLVQVKNLVDLLMLQIPFLQQCTS